MARKATKGKTEIQTTEAKLRAVRLELPEELHRLLRLEAAKRDTSLAELARALVSEALSKPGRKGGAE